MQGEGTRCALEDGRCLGGIRRLLGGGCSAPPTPRDATSKGGLRVRSCVGWVLIGVGECVEWREGLVRRLVRSHRRERQHSSATGVEADSTTATTASSCTMPHLCRRLEDWADAHHLRLLLKGEGRHDGSEYAGREVKEGEDCRRCRRGCRRSGLDPCRLHLINYIHHWSHSARSLGRGGSVKIPWSTLHGYSTVHP